MDLGFPEILIVVAIFMLLFGANKLPQLGKGLGEAIRNFKDGMRDEPPARSSGALPAPEEAPGATPPSAGKR